ncbi:MAG: ribosomal protein S18-alanine N-acetyltransferase [Lachnospiraceae bacterium]|nr:ribosomal protein S18-alanine N-acetyltransferase [Lachnospiraceae bacterium]
MTDTNRTNEAASISAVSIRELTIDDIDSIAALEAADSQTPWNRNSLLTYFFRDDTVMLVAESGGELIGFCGLLLLTPEAEVLDITVSHTVRNRGIGFRLLHEAMNKGHARGVNVVYLEVRDSNAPARHLYEKLGFEAYGRRPRYYTNPTEDAIVMKHEVTALS